MELRFGSIGSHAFDGPGASACPFGAINHGGGQRARQTRLVTESISEPSCLPIGDELGDSGSLPKTDGREAVTHGFR